MMRKLWNELTKDERVRVITIGIDVITASIACWIVTMIFVPEFNGIFIPIQEWKSVLRSSGYWTAFGLNTVITALLAVVSWFTMTTEWRKGVKKFARDYVIDCVNYFR